jgi:S-layer protein
MAYTMEQLTTFFTNANAGTAPTGAQVLALQAIYTEANAPGGTNEVALAKVINLASDYTTGVSVQAYQFFLGFAPSEAGLASLNASYVGTGSQASLNGENRFIAQSISLALQNPTAKANFSASYGSLSIEAATRAAYDIIIGNAAAKAAGVNIDAAIKFFTDQTAYFTAFVKQVLPNATADEQALAVKAAIIGEIMYQGQKYNDGAGLGAYAAASTNLIKDLADDGHLTANNAAGVPLFANYGSGGAGSAFVLTTGVDTIPGTGGDDTITALIDGTTGAVATTLTGLDTINGGAGNDTVNLNVLNGSGVAGTAVAAIPTVSVSSVETANVRSQVGFTGDFSSWAGLTSLNFTQGTAVALTAAGTTNVAVSGATGAIGVDGGLNVTVTDSTAAQNITVGAATVAKGSVTVTDTNQTTGNIAVDGGTTVSVTAAKNSGGTITVGNGGAATDLPTGAITVSSTGAAYVAAGSPTLGDITVKGGTTVTVTQVASSDLSAQAKDGAAGTITQGDVAITGGDATTEVTVNQTAAVTGQNYIAAAGSKETQTVTFTALAANGTATVNGLTFTAAKALTAAEVAAAFANLTNGATTGPASVTNGTYTGAFNTLGFTTGAVTTSGGVSTVTLTGAANGNLALAAFAGGATVTAGTDGVATTAGQAGIATIVGGDVDVNGAITGADVLAKVTLNGYGAGSSVTSDALTALNLANSDSDVSVTNTAATTLALGLDNVGANAAATVGLGATYTTLNITATSASAANITAGGVTALTVGGSAVANLTGSTLGALKTLTTTGSAGVTLNTAAATLTSVDTTASTGKSTVSIDGTKATYTGGAGVDVVTLTTVAPTKAISLGGGDDTLNLAAGTTSSTGVLDGGAGTDILGMAAADAATASLAATFATKFTGFEKLSLGSAAAAQSIDLSNLNNINYVISAGTAAGITETLTKFVNGGTLEVTGGTATSVIDVQLADATGTTDSLNVVTKASAALNVGSIKAAGVETISLTATDSAASTIDTHTVSIDDSALKALTIGGNAKVALTYNSTALTSVDASANTGGVTISTLAGAAAKATITGGSGADTLTANHASDTLIGGAGDDSLTVNANLVTLTGGAGADTFNVSFAVSNSSGYATITDASATDTLVFANTASAETFTSAKIVLGDTAVFQDYANEAIQTTNEGAITWFQFGGNTYIVENMADGSSFTNGTDIIVKLAGNIDLSTASFNASSQTLVLH